MLPTLHSLLPSSLQGSVCPTSQPPSQLWLLLESVFGPLEVLMPGAPPCTLPPPPPETLVPGTGIFNSWWFFPVVLPGSQRLLQPFLTCTLTLPHFPQDGPRQRVRRGDSDRPPLSIQGVPLWRGLEADPGNQWRAWSPPCPPQCWGTRGGRLVGGGEREGATAGGAGCLRLGQPPQRAVGRK